MQTGVIVAPKYDMGQAVVDRPLDALLTVAWQVPLTGFYTREARLDSVSGVAMLTSSEHGVLALGAAPPDLRSDAGRWPVPVRVVGSGYPGQLMVVDNSGMVYRLSPERPPMPVWESTEHPDEVDVVGLPGGRLLASCFDDSWSETQLVEEATGHIVWRSPVVQAPVMPVGDQLIGISHMAPSRGDLVSLDVRTGLERWRRPGGSLWGADIVAVVRAVLWVDDRINNQLVGFSVDSGRPMARVALPRTSRLTGVLDQAGVLHIVDEHGWLAVDLTQARVVADVRFEVSGMGRVYQSRTIRSADGRLVLADDRGQIFVMHPAQPQRPELVATCPQVRGIGIAEGRLIVLSHDGTLTALGAPS
ncbi:hypothetical protein F5972_08345 [Microbispora cellulosiformans]|uniref:PQQ-binding-like beta-propeller repeat protein n=1 Tax=Microbispora cellulosiformans TaxID=2614688 RepID=A0A5J5K5A6_9ACTN|nr:hypothetical protein [Microbispora cellulosiformans]KAA9379652.1 hypothetical protein F5972_08345 [Microbispora cellulosiformans]